jgi:hypothetical protein
MPWIDTNEIEYLLPDSTDAMRPDTDAGSMDGDWDSFKRSRPVH